MRLHPWYPASIWRAGTELFIFDSLARLPSRALHMMAGAGSRHLSFWPAHHLSASCSSTQLVFGKPPWFPQLVYEIKGDSVSSSRAGNVALAWSISVVHLALCLDWGCSQDTNWENHGKPSAKTVREQQESFCWVVKLWGYRSGPTSSHLVHYGEILPKSEVSKENRAEREREKSILFDGIKTPVFSCSQSSTPWTFSVK